MNNLKIILTVGLVVCLATQLFSQTLIMSNGNTEYSCTGTFLDPGGSGNYPKNLDYTYTLCPSSPGSINLVFNSFSVEGGFDYLSIYDGNSTADPLMGVFDNNTGSPGTVQATSSNPTGCLTFVFHSDNIFQYSGWDATISCALPCQTVDAVIATTTPIANASDEIDVCQGDNVNFTAGANYPQNGTYYAQSDGTSVFLWSFGDGTTATGQNVNHVFPNQDAYSVSLVVYDVNSCKSTNSEKKIVRVSTTPDFSGSTINPSSICLGEQAQIGGVATPVQGTLNCSPPAGSQTFLPDGVGGSFTSTTTIDCYNIGQTVTNSSDILNICSNMEHSYLGDLSIQINCPNGQSMNIITFAGNGGGGTILGEPIATNLPQDNNSSNTDPGVGYDYCWSPTASNGQIDQAANWITIPTYTDGNGNSSNNINQVPAGTYQIQGNWNNLVGCPLNGDWEIEITDNQLDDNGYVFFWSINFDPVLTPPTYLYTPTIVSVAWQANPTIVSTTVSDITVQPTAIGASCYTYEVTDDFGCAYDTSLCVNVVSGITITTNSQTNPSCSLPCNGSINTTASGGGTSYSYSWSGGQNTSTATGLCAGVHTLTVTSGTCEALESYTLTSPAQVSVSTTLTNAACGVNDGQITAVGNGGTTPYFYSWNNGQSTATATGLGAGNYTLTLTDNASCFITISDVVVNPTPSVSITSVTDISCFGGSNGQITIGASGGLTPYSYSWSNGETTSSISALSASNYSITVTDATPCINIVGQIVNQPAEISISEILNNVNCNGYSDGSITTSTIGGTSPYNYLWSSSAGNTTNNSVSGLPFGTYQVSVTDVNSCVSSKNYTLTEPLLMLTASITCTPVSTVGGSDGTSSVSVNGGSTPYFYQWNNGQSTASATGLGAGNHQVTITDNNGCTTTESCSVTSPGCAISVTLNLSNINCNGFSNGDILTTTSGGTTPYSYLWNTNQTTGNITGLFPGNYIVTITDAALCTQISSATITEPSAITVTTSTTITSCFGNADGIANVTSAVGGQTPYSYSWSNNSTNASATGLLSGNYMVSVIDANLCTAVTNISVGSASSINLNITSTAPNCNGGLDGSIGATASGGSSPYFYLWNTNVTTAAISGIAAATYTLTFTDNSGCSIVTATTVSEPQAISVTAATSAISCPGGADGSVTVTVSGGASPYNYFWISGQTSSVLTGLSAGQINLSVSDNNGCFYFSPTQVPTSCVEIKRILVDACGTPENEHEMFFFQVGPSALSTSTIDVDWPNNGWLGLCTNPTWIANMNATITAGGLLVEPTGGVLPAGANVLMVTSDNPTSTSNSFANLSGTLYVLFQCDQASTAGHFKNYDAAGGSRSLSIDFGGGCTDTVSYDVDSLVTATGVLGAQDGGTVTFDYSGVDNYSNSGCVAPFDTINYIVVVEITENPPMQITMDSAAVSCAGGSDGSATASATGGLTPYTYFWAVGAGIQNTPTATGLDAQVFIVTVKDASGCSAFNSTTVTEPSPITVTATVTLAACAGSDGSATIMAIGGTGTTYTYLWNNGQTTSTITGQPAGVYTITTTDTNGCEVHSNAIINNPAPILVFSDSTMITCFGGSGGSATISASGGVTPYAYNWTNGSTTNVTSGLMAGTYFVTVSDNSSCVAFASMTIIEPPQLLVTPSFIGISCFGNSDGIAIANVSGGATPYIYQWDINALSQLTDSAFNLEPMVYSVTVTDDSLCSVFGTTTVTSPTAITVSGSNTNNLCFGDSTATAFSFATGGTPSFSYLWPNGQTTNSAAGLQSGIQILTVTDANNCLELYSITVSQPLAPISLALTSDTVSCFGDVDGGLTASAVGGTSPYFYLWDNNTGNQTNATVTGLGSGAYLLTVSDANNCKNFAGGVVNQPTALGTTNSLNNVSCFGTSNGQITTAVVGGTLPYLYSWSNGNSTSNIAGLSGGTYIVSIVDNHNCSITQSITITEPSTSLITSVTAVNENCNSVDGQVITSAVGGTSPYSYLWSGGETTSTLTGLSAGNYSVLILDANNCSQNQTTTVLSIGGFSVTLSANDLLCNNDGSGSISSNTTGGVTPFSYIWSNGLTTSNISGIGAGGYSLTITDGSGCSDNQPAIVNEPSAIGISLATTDASCANNDGQLVASVNGGVPPYSYVWNNGSTLSSVNGLSSGNYSLTVSNTNDCSANTTGTILSAGNVLADFTFNQNQNFVPSDVSFTNTSSGALLYDWDFGNALTSTETNPATTYSASGEFTVLLTAYSDSSKNCFDTMQVTIEVFGESSLMIPIVFSPNGDGINDIFKVDALFIETFEASIFNRWGMELYSWDKINGGWDGRTYSGEEVPQGTYFIVIKAVGTDGVEYNGDDTKKTITLLRK